MIEILQGTVYLDKAAPEAGGGGGGDLNEYLKRSSVPVIVADDYDEVTDADEANTVYAPEQSLVFEAYDEEEIRNCIFVVNPKEIDPDLEDESALDTYVWAVSWVSDEVVQLSLVGTNIYVNGTLEEDEETGDHRIVYGYISNPLTNRIVQCTQAEYDALVAGGTVDDNTIYCIIPTQE